MVSALLTISELAKELAVTEDRALELARRSGVEGMVLLNSGQLLFPQDKVERLRATT